MLINIFSVSWSDGFGELQYESILLGLDLTQPDAYFPQYCIGKVLSVFIVDRSV